MAMPVCQSCGSQYELETLPEFESEFEFEGEFEGETGLEGEGWLGAIGNVVGSLLGESEFEGEFEGEGELEFESEFEAGINPIRKIYADAMLEHLGELAAEAETEQEAIEHLAPAVHIATSKVLPVVAKAVGPAAKRAAPHVAKAVTRAAPHLTRAVGKITGGLHKNPHTRPLLRAVPTIARRTVHSVARQAAHGRPVTPRTAVRTLAHQTRRVLGSPRHRAHALRHHRLMDRRFHRHVGKRMALPHWRYAGRPVAGGVVGAPVPGVPATHVAAPGAAPAKQVRTVTSGGRPVRQVRYVGGSPGAPVVRAAGRPGVATRPGIAGGTVCPPCPVCGASTVAPAVAAATPTPAYCRCCGQLLR